MVGVKKVNKKIDKSEGIGKVDSQVSGLKYQLARALADYDNLKKRVEREQEIFLKFANTGLIAKFLGVYDMLVSAQSHLGDSGLAIALEEFKKALNDEGVEEIKAEVGSDFNDELFEAVEALKGKSKKNAGKVAEVVLSGWKFADGPVIRPVKVKVYKK